MGTVADNLLAVQASIEAAAKKAGRDPGAARLVAVTKTVPAVKVMEAVLAGARILGENRVQEAMTKMRELGAGQGVEWHLIGSLQKNKARLAVGSFSLIHSVDSTELAREIDRQALRRGIVQAALLEVNIAGEASKYGLRPEEVVLTAKEVSLLPGVRLAGLMCIPPFAGDPETSRPYFRALKGLLLDMNRAGLDVHELSMGMTQDYKVAVEEGATLVRVGTAIFGARADIHG